MPATHLSAGDKGALVLADAHRDDDAWRVLSPGGLGIDPEAISMSAGGGINTSGGDLTPTTSSAASCSLSMASRGKRSARNPPDGNDRGKRAVPWGQTVPLGETSRSRSTEVAEEEEPKSLLVLHEQLREATEQYMAVAAREQEFSDMIIGRQEVRIAFLQRRVAELTAKLARHGGS